MFRSIVLIGQLSTGHLIHSGTNKAVAEQRQSRMDIDTAISP